MLIGEVAKRSGVSARMLRHYESLGLIDPSERTPNGYREYSAADIGRIFHIEGLRKLGMSLAEIGTLLNDPAFDPSLLIHELIETSRRRIAVEQELLSKLERIDRLHHADGEALLLTIDLMRSLESGDVIQRHKAALGSGVDGTVPVESLSAVVLNDPVLNAAGAMRWALAQSGPEAIRYLAKGMGDLSVEVRRNALQALDEIRRNTAKEELGSVAEATIIESLHSGLGDTDLQVRSSAALILGQMA
ncbi:MAG: MerR family DNA-binding transcriptional regulator, partial [Brevibacterium sp.]|nr:MerR family DNA-binding transcriptional regulator [Brevibacterium sp.]